MQKPNEKAAELIAVFQLAILELSAKMVAEKETMSASDVENVNYVVGMASVNSFNLEQVIKHGENYYQANRELVDKLLAEAGVFAESLSVENLQVN